MKTLKVWITPTEHEKRELSRFACAAYAADCNRLGHLASGVASLPKGGYTTTARWDEVMGPYRAWLIGGAV